MRLGIGPIAKKEARQILRDRRTLAVLFFFPLFLLVMFGYAISLDVKHISLSVMDYDRSDDSRRLVQKIVRNEYFDLQGYIESNGRIEKMLERGETQCVLVVPKGYQRSIGRGEQATLQVLVDGTNSTIGATAVGYIQLIVAEISADYRNTRVQRAGIDGGVSGEKGGVTAEGMLPGSLEFEPRVLFNPQLKSPIYLVPGLISLILVVTAVMSTAMSIVREKEHGTMEQIIVSPVHPVSYVLGKTAPYTILSLLIAFLVLLTGRVFFGIEVEGNPLILLLVTFVFLTACLALGIFISTLADSQQVAFLIATIVTLLPTFILSGFVFPIKNMPVVIQAVTYIIPARYYLAMLRGLLLKGAGLVHFWEDLLALLLLAVLTLGISAVRMRRGGLV